MRETRLGVLTKTVIRSPVVKWILHAQIRHRKLNDVVLVGDHFIQVKQVGEEGHLQHVAHKTDFDARIRAANVFGLTDSSEEDVLVKDEKDDATAQSTTAPPQLVVLTLDSNDLVFLYLITNSDGSLRFVQQSCPMPTFDRILYQPGEHLAIDPHARAVAVAANEREVVLYSAKTKDRLTLELRLGNKDWCPVSAQRPLQVDGVIQHIDFLIPGVGDEDHIILLVIVAEKGTIKAVWIDWYYSSDLQQAQIHPSQPLYSANTVPSLLIPLSNANFMVISGEEMMLVKNIVSGSATVITLNSLESVAVQSGSSPRRPLWASWCRPRRTRNGSRDKDHLYLAREDGLVFWVLCTSHDRIESSFAGDLECNIGTAFASLGNDEDPDILAVSGDMSSGRVVSIGHWPRGGRLSQLSRSDTMEMSLIETIPNWASTTDMISTNLPHHYGRLSRSTDSILVTSGRAPYGAITEIRRGLEARLSAWFELDGLRSVTGVWTMPVAASDSLLILLARPSSTQVLEVPDCDFEQTQELGATASLALDTAHRTITADVTASGHIIQITDNSICITMTPSSNFEDSAKRSCKAGESILAAAIDVSGPMFVTADRRHGMFFLCCFCLSESPESTSALLRVGDYQQGKPNKLEYEPLAVAAATLDAETFIAVATSNGQLRFFVFDHKSRSSQSVGQVVFPGPADSLRLCDSLLLLQGASASQLLVACGLRDGTLFSAGVDVNDGTDISTGVGRVVKIGSTSVKLTQCGEAGRCAMGISGSDTCLITCDDNDSEELTIQSVWVSDKVRPALAQPTLVACNMMPPAELLATNEFDGAMVLIGGDDFMVATLARIAGMVPRQIPVSGAPNRVLYAEQQRCLVVASLCAEAKTAESNAARGEQKRSIWPAIDFISARDSEPSCTYDLQPGERVYALLEWSFKLPEEDRTWSFVLVGGSYVRSSGKQRGRVTFLQPTNRKWEIVDVKQGRSESFEAPVYALALYDDLTYVACSGQQVFLQRFTVEGRRWASLCEPFRLASAGVFATVSDRLIYISTAEDSLVVLRLEGDDGEAEGLRKLVLVSTAPKAHTSLSHMVLDTETAEDKTPLVLLSTKYGQLVGLKSPLPSVSERSQSSTADIVFEARLPISLTRLRRGSFRASWKAEPPEGILVDNIIGTAADGSVTGIAILNFELWRRLCWLQRLCEWSEDLSPHSYQTPAYSATEVSYGRDERAVPIGLSRQASNEEIVLRAPSDPLAESHIDGDVLARLLEHGGANKLRELIRTIAQRDDRVGTWIRQHEEDELNAVDETMEILRRLLDSWL